MLGFLLAKIPAELVCEIALFEGRIFRAYLRDYICEVYARVYKYYFGYRYTLRVICGTQWKRYRYADWAGSTNRHDQMASLPFYTAWSTMIRQVRPEVVKQRKCRFHMRPYVGIIPPARLNRERVNIEKEMAHFFCPKTGGAHYFRYRGLVRPH